MKIISRPSPNFDDRDGQSVDMLVLHYTGMKTATGALDRLCDAAAKVSAHYMVDEDGSVWELVHESKRAWHAGVSFWRGNSNINQRSIGIEIVNPGHEYGYRPFPQAQMESVATLCKAILARHDIPARNVVGHSDVAPERKEDPGELFDWKRLAAQGVGLWPLTSPSPLAGEGRDGGAVDGFKVNGESPHPPTPSGFGGRSPNPPPQGGRGLEKYGYSTADLPATITAFQRHFRQKSLTGQWDEECASLLSYLLGVS